MSVDFSKASPARIPDAAALLARVAKAERRAEARLVTAIDDLFLVEEDRLDDRTRAAVGALLMAIVQSLVREVVADASPHLAGRPAAAALDAADVPVLLGRLLDAGVLRDRALMDELLGQVRQSLLGDTLLANRPPRTQPTLLPRLTLCNDGVMAAAAMAYLLADNRRRSPDGNRPAELPAAVHRHLVWWIAAALRQTGNSSRQSEVDRVLAATAERILAAYDEQDRLDAVAQRLAAAINPRPAELGELLVDAIEEGHAALFIGILAHVLSIDFIEARALVLDPAGERLWLALRAYGQDRPTIARIGLALADADPRRDVEAFADTLDVIAAISQDDARHALAPLSLHPDYRAAVRALEHKDHR
jgi:hypothetical protein